MQRQSKSGSDQLAPVKLVGQNAFDLPSEATGLFLKRVPRVDQGDVHLGHLPVALPNLFWRPEFDGLVQGQDRLVVVPPIHRGDPASLRPFHGPGFAWCYSLAWIALCVKSSAP
jgi:hypothetical protein